MAEEKRKVLLFGKRWSGRTTLANMLVSGKLQEFPLKTTDTDSICKTYVGRGWAVIDTMGFGEPLGGTVPDKYVRKMAVDFLNEVKGRFSHIIFMVKAKDIPRDVHDKDDKYAILSIMWKIFLGIFRGGEENFVVLVTKVTPSMKNGPVAITRQIKEMFPECKHFRYADFTVSDRELSSLEKEMKRMFKAFPWVEPFISKMGDEEINEMAIKITRQLMSYRQTGTLSSEWWPEECGQTSSEWWSEESGQYEPCYTPYYYDAGRLYALHSRTENLRIEMRRQVERVLTYQEQMQNVYMEVKFYRGQCRYLFDRIMAALKEIHELLVGSEMPQDERYVKHLRIALNRLESCLETGKKLLHLCSDSKEVHNVALALSSRPVSDINSFSRFALVVRDLEWSLDVLRFLLHNPEAQGASESEPPFWLAKFLWCEARCRLVYTSDGDMNITVAGLVAQSSVAADNNRHTQDQQDLIPSIKSHLIKTKQNRGRVQNKILNLIWAKKANQAFNYMSFLENRLQGDASFKDSSKVPGCFRIPGKQKYKSIKELGLGSFKRVYSCKWLGMKVAVATSRYDGGGTILEAEAALLARVQHPNVVTFIGYSFDEEKQRDYLVTEIMETSLRSLVNKNRLSWNESHPFTISESIDILLQIVEAMIHVHQCGMLHLDLKAENFLVNCRRRPVHSTPAVVKLTDFGESKLQSPGTDCIFETKDVLGTRAWMPPEVYGRTRDEVKLYSWSADVYRFGMTCYEVVTGEEPFAQIRGPVLQEMVSLGKQPEIPSNVPEGIKKIMKSCWDYHPEDRPTFKAIRRRLWDLKLYFSIWDADGVKVPSRGPLHNIATKRILHSLSVPTCHLLLPH